jgi:hypothetical protein
MSSSLFRKCRRGLALLLVAATGLACVFAFGRTGAESGAAADLDLLSMDLDGFRYEYHVPTGREGLYDDQRDPHELVNVLPEHEATAAACRRALVQKLNVTSLESLRARHADATRQLASLGYL